MDATRPAGAPRQRPRRRRRRRSVGAGGPPPRGGAVSSTRQGAFLSTYSVTSPDLRRARASDAAEDRPRRASGVGGSPPITISSTFAAPRLLDDPRADAARPDHGGLDLDRLVLLADLLGALERRLGRLQPLLRRRRVERHRQRQVEHVDHLELRAPPRPARRPASASRPGGADDVVVELGPEHRHEDVAVLGLAHLLAQRLLRHRDPLRQRRPLDEPAVDHVGDQAEHHPAAAHPARVLVEDEHADPQQRHQHRAGDRRQRKRCARRSRTSNGIRNGRSRSGSVQRSRMIDRWAIAIASVAPNA